MLLTTTHCPVCQSDDTSVVYATAQDYITNKMFQVWKCSNCDISYTDPRTKDLSPFYPEKYRRYSSLILNILKFLYRMRAKKWSRSFKSPGTVFEMGCGDGIMLSALRKQGWQVFGNERTLQSAYFARHKLNLPVFVGELDSLNLAPIADLVILFQVLEHLENPVETLKQLNHLIKLDGKLIIGVPNFDSWQSKITKDRWFHLDVPRHFFHFSLKSLEFCLRSSGFAITQVSYISLEHDPYGWVQSILNHFDKKRNSLTRLLLKLDKPNLTAIIHLALVLFIGALSLPISIVSWVFNRGAILEVTAQKSSTL